MSDNEIEFTALRFAEQFKENPEVFPMAFEKKFHSLPEINRIDLFETVCDILSGEEQIPSKDDYVSFAVSKLAFTALMSDSDRLRLNLALEGRKYILEYHIKNKNKKKMAELCHKIGQIFLDLNNLHDCWEPIQKAISLYRELKDIVNEISSYQLYSSGVCSLVPYYEAIEEYEKIADEYKKQGNKKEEARCYHCIGLFYIFGLGQIEKGQEYCDKAIELNKT